MWLNNFDIKLTLRKTLSTSVDWETENLAVFGQTDKIWWNDDQNLPNEIMFY